MMETYIFLDRLMWGALVCLVVSLFWANRVAVQATQVKNYNGDAVTTLNLDMGKFARAMMFFSAVTTGIWTIALVVWETHEYLKDSGYVG